MGHDIYLLACSLGDKVYVLEPMYRAERTIHVLYNPDASFSLQDPPHWQGVVVKHDFKLIRNTAAFVPLNSTEIAILGGYDKNGRMDGDVFTFNTSTNKFNKRMV